MPSSGPELMSHGLSTCPSLLLDLDLLQSRGVSFVIQQTCTEHLPRAGLSPGTMAVNETDKDSGLTELTLVGREIMCTLDKQTNSESVKCGTIN